MTGGIEGVLTATSCGDILRHDNMKRHAALMSRGKTDTDFRKSSSS